MNLLKRARKKAEKQRECVSLKTNHPRLLGLDTQRDVKPICPFPRKQRVTSNKQTKGRRSAPSAHTVPDSTLCNPINPARHTYK